jgi:VWFA-related protein
MDINKMFRLTAKTPFSGLGKGLRPLTTLLALVMMQMGAAGTAPSPQEQGPVKLQQPLQYEVSVVLKLIHVYVTDKKGNPVRDLTRDDFTVTDNGQPVNLTDFEMHVLEAAPKEPVSEKPAEAAAPKTVPEAPAVRPASRKFFLFFDMAFNNARGITKAKTAALHFLDAKVKPEDEVGILSYSMFKGVAVHEYLTADHGKIREVLKKIDQRGIAGRANEIEDWYWRLVQEPLPGPESQQLGAQTEGQVPYYLYDAKVQREESKKIAQTFILKLTTLAKALRYIPGQKQFILFSSGVPSSLIYGTQAGNPTSTTRAGSWGGGSQLDAGDPTIRNQNENMYKEFSASGCTFYAFDTRESAKGMDLFGYDSQTFETGGRGLLSAQGVFQDPNNIMRDDRMTGLNSLKRLTDITGGKYYSNINRYEKNLDQVQSLTGTYYVLGYPINEHWDGQFHEVKVDVKRKGCEVRAQAGYFSPKPYREYTNLEKQLHLYDLALNERAFSRMPVSFPMTVLSFASGEQSRLGMLAKVPGEITAKFSGKRVEFVAIVFDGKGDIQDVARRETEPNRGQSIIFMTESALAPGDYSCRLVIRDMDTGMSAVASAKRTVGTTLPAGLELHTPLLLAEATGSAFIEAGSGKTRGRLSWTEAYPFDRLKFTPVVGEVSKSLDSFKVVLPYSFRGAGQPDFGLSGSLINAATGVRMPVSLSLLEMNQNGSVGVLNLEVPMSGLSPGRYILYIHAEDKVSKAMAHVQTTFVVTGD